MKDLNKPLLAKGLHEYAEKDSTITEVLRRLKKDGDIKCIHCGDLWQSSRKQCYGKNATNGVHVFV